MQSPALHGSVDVLSLDVDGTLYSLTRLKLRYFLAKPWRVRAVLAMGWARETIRARGEPVADFWAEHDRLAAERLGWPEARVREAREELMTSTWPGILRAIGPFPGLRDALERLVGAGVRIAALSDYPSATKLEALGLGDLPWAQVIDASELGALKPRPEPFQALVDGVGVPAERILHVGDRIDTDVEGALGFGMMAGLWDPKGRAAPPPGAAMLSDYHTLADAVLLTRRGD